MYAIDGWNSLSPLIPPTMGNRTLALGIPGGYEWIIILLVVLIFFGNRIPGMARSLGSGINEFKSGLKEGQAEGKDGGSTKTLSKSNGPGSTEEGSGGEGS